jgi:hypothetical protein
MFTANNIGGKEYSNTIYRKWQDKLLGVMVQALNRGVERVGWGWFGFHTLERGVKVIGIRSFSCLLVVLFHLRIII